MYCIRIPQVEKLAMTGLQRGKIAVAQTGQLSGPQAFPVHFLPSAQQPLEALVRHMAFSSCAQVQQKQPHSCN